MGIINEKPPGKLDGAFVLYYVLLSPEQTKTLRTRHFVDGKLIEKIPALAICRYKKDNGIYLFHCDENWEVITDDLFDSIEEAYVQSSLQYNNLKQIDWIKFEG